MNDEEKALELIYNPKIKDCYSNFISNFDVKSKQEFNQMINEAYGRNF